MLPKKLYITAVTNANKYIQFFFMSVGFFTSKAVGEERLYRRDLFL